MAANTLNILMPSVNNLTARVFVRAAGLDFEEVDVWGQTTTPEFLAKDPAAPDAAARGGRPAARLAVGELRDHAVPLQQARARPPLPHRSGRARDDRQRDVLFDRHLLSAGRARHLPGARLPAVRGRGGDLGRERRPQGAGPAGRTAALAEPLEAFHAHFMDGRRFIGGDSPTIADIRLAATLEFLRGIDYDFPAWAEEYMSAVEAALGDAYSEPAGDVRGFVSSATSGG